MHPTIGADTEAELAELERDAQRLHDDGRLDASFRPRFAFNQGNRPGVYALAQRLGDDLYVGGKFTSVNGRPRSGAAAIDAATGLLTLAFAPELKDINPDDEVVQVVRILDHDDHIYLCGDYWQIEGIGGHGRQGASAAPSEKFFPVYPKAWSGVKCPAADAPPTAAPPRAGRESSARAPARSRPSGCRPAPAPPTSGRSPA